MPNYLKTKTGWRTQIYVDGIRESKTFGTKHDAKEWAQDRVRELKYPDKEKKSKSSISTSSQIVEAALPLHLSTGIFFLIKDAKIVYIGQSMQLQKVIEQYFNNNKFDHINVIACPSQNLDKYQAHFVEMYQPVLNNLDMTEFGDKEQSCQIS